MDIKKNAPIPQQPIINKFKLEKYNVKNINIADSTKGIALWIYNRLKGIQKYMIKINSCHWNNSNIARNKFLSSIITVK